MKRNLLLNLSVLLATIPSLVAQTSTDYIPLVQEGVRWEGEIMVDGWLYEQMEFHPYSIIIEGDTTINNVNYKKCHYLFPEFTPTPNKYTIAAYLREDLNEHKVYALYEESYTSPINTMWGGDLYYDCLEKGFHEVLLYDFDNPENPDLYTQSNNWGQVSIDSTKIITTNDGVARQCHYLNDEEYYIEGIGYVSASYMGGDLLFRFPTLAACHCNTLTYFKRFYSADNTLVYESPYNTSFYGPELLTRDNVRWEYLFKNTDLISDVTTETTFWIEMKETHLIDNKYYRRCVAWSNENDTITLGYVRDDEKNNQVLCRYEYDKNNEIVLYDYNNITNAAPLQYINTAFTNISTENFRYSYRDHDKFTVTDDNDNTIFQIIEGIGIISDGTSFCNGHLLSYPTIAQPDSRDYQIIFSRILNTKDNSTIFEAPASIENIIADKGYQIISFNNGVISSTQDAYIEVVDLNGRKVASTQGTSLSTTSLHSGIYVVRAITKSDNEIIKIAIK
ncbi:MAG: T9SS type A sorting domain-containing protein [Muribaculaceae bacterium]|nr:T9SS type A sorting domain-containing protein [Muribaculaceae bacterium]